MAFASFSMIEGRPVSSLSNAANGTSRQPGTFESSRTLPLSPSMIPGSPAPRAQTSGCCSRRIATSRKTAASRLSAPSCWRVGIGWDRAMISLPETTPGFYAGPTKVDPDCDLRVHRADGSPMLRLAMIRKPSSVRFGCTAPISGSSSRDQLRITTRSRRFSVCAGENSRD